MFELGSCSCSIRVPKFLSFHCLTIRYVMGRFGEATSQPPASQPQGGPRIPLPKHPRQPLLQPLDKEPEVQPVYGLLVHGTTGSQRHGALPGSGTWKGRSPNTFPRNERKHHRDRRWATRTDSTNKNSARGAIKTSTRRNESNSATDSSSQKKKNTSRRRHMA